MTILMPDGRKYLFNRHTGMQQLWMASPISGGRHFALMNHGGSAANPDSQDHTSCLHRSFVADGHDGDAHPRPSGHTAYWRDTRNREIIESVMNAELANQWNIDLGLKPFQAVTAQNTMTPWDTV